MNGLALPTGRSVERRRARRPVACFAVLAGSAVARFNSSRLLVAEPIGAGEAARWIGATR